MLTLGANKGNKFLMGQWARIYAEFAGAPALDYMENIPNDGLIRYLNIFNTERVLPTTPKALAEVLVHKNYDFQKPSQLRHGLGRLLGVGILLAEGDEHKVRRQPLINLNIA